MTTLIITVTITITLTNTITTISPKAKTISSRVCDHFGLLSLLFFFPFLFLLFRTISDYFAFGNGKDEQISPQNFHENLIQNIDKINECLHEQNRTLLTCASRNYGFPVSFIFIYFNGVYFNGVP